MNVIGHFSKVFKLSLIFHGLFHLYLMTYLEKTFLFSFFYWIFYLFTFQMLSPFLVSPLKLPYPHPNPSPMRVPPIPPHHPSIPLH